MIGVNSFTETAPSPLLGDGEIENILRVDHHVEAEQIADLERWRAQRDDAKVRAALDELRRVAEDDGPEGNVMPATIALAHAGGTTGEWADALREVFGEFRAPTGVGGGVGRRGEELAPIRVRTQQLAERTGGPPRLLVAKPGLDGHSNGAEQIAVAARDAGFEVIYQGIRLTPAQIVAAALDEDVDIVGLSILSGSHLELVPDVLDRLRAAGSTAAVVVGGIIPPDDAELLIGKGVASVYTPKDYSFDAHHGGSAGAGRAPTRRHSRVSRAIWRHVTGTAPSAIACAAEALGQVVVVQRRGAPVDLVRRGEGCRAPRPWRAARRGRSASRWDQRSARPRDGGRLPPVVDVDGQRRVQGRSRLTGTGLFHQRPLKRQASCTGLQLVGRGGAAARPAARPTRWRRAQPGRVRAAGAGRGAPGRSRAGAHSGTLPCLRRGSSSRLEARMSRLRQITDRVSAGEITSSM